MPRKSSKAPLRQAQRGLSSQFRKLTPAEHRLKGLKPSAKRYVLKIVGKVRKRTPTITHRDFITRKTREETGLASPEIATKARQSDALAYKSERARVTASRNKDTSFEKRTRARIADDIATGKRIRERNADGSFKTSRRRSAPYRLRSDAAAHYFELRRRKLAGEFLDDGDWHWLADMAGEYGDPLAEALRAYPPGYGVRDTAA
jgi:hypothetical protein